MAVTSGPKAKAKYYEQEAAEQRRKAQNEIDPDMRRRRYKAAEDAERSARGYRETIKEAYDQT